MRDPMKDLENMDRVPGEEERREMEKNGMTPPGRLYAAGGEPVELAEAMANLVARRKGKKPIKAGGLDDMDEKLYIKYEDSGPYAKLKTVQHGALDEGDVARIKANGRESAKEEASGPPAGEVGSDGGGVFLPPAVGVGMVGTERGDLLPEIGFPAGELKPGPPTVMYVDRPVEKVVEKVVEKIVERETEVSKWLKRRTRVGITMGDVTFSISAIAVVKADHALTVFLPTANDAMTFIPKVGASVSVSNDGEQADTIFTGASFDIPELGVLGLAFLIPNERSVEG